MALFPTPRYDLNTGQISTTFNINDFAINDSSITSAELRNYANLFKPNQFTQTNFFTNLQFYDTINFITVSTFALISQLPTIIANLTGFSYDATTLTTYISNNTYFTNTAINNNLAVSNINAGNIISQTLTTNNSIFTGSLTVKNVPFTDICCYLYINSLCFPIIKTNLMTNFNINQINNISISIKPFYRADFVDINNVILYSVTNTTADFIYNQIVPYNLNFQTINIYDSFNRLIV